MTSTLDDARREQQLRIQALGAALSRRDWHEAERRAMQILKEISELPEDLQFYIASALGSPPSEAGREMDKRPNDAPEWLWYGEVNAVDVVTFGRWPKRGAKWRYKWADIQPTEHDHPKTARRTFEEIIASLNYDGAETDSLTVGEIRRALAALSRPDQGTVAVSSADRGGVA